MWPVRALILALAFLLNATAATPDAERVKKLEEGLLAPCCYAEPVARHNSEVAAKMRAEITSWVAEGKSDAAILAIYKERYGLRVLAEPEGARFLWLSLIPWVAFAIGFAIVVLVIRKLRAPPADVPA
jgi:cytochrome c-type biogenesis protein CcmH